jgi:quinol monooxygenase YgiN
MNSNLMGFEKVVAKADHIEQVREILTNGAIRTREVPGVVKVELFQKLQNPTEFFFYAEIETMSVMETLGQADWRAELEAALKPLLETDVELALGSAIA